MAEKAASILENSRSDYEKLLNIACNGLPVARSKKKIIVVGAGMAGLSAAYVLHKAGHEVIILEASDHVGGRVMTYRDKAGWEVDLGAMRIPEQHKLVHSFIKLFQLQTKEFVDKDPEAYYYINGVLQKQKDYKKNPESFRFNLLPEEKGKSSVELFTSAVQPYLEELRSEGYGNFNKKYGHISLAEFLETKTTLSQDAISLFGKLDNMESCMSFAFPVILECYFQLHSDTKFLCLKGGNDQLPKAFQEVLHEHIIFNAKVIKIRQNAQGVVAEYQDEHESTKSNVTGDYLIMTASAPIASVTKFDPPLSMEKQDALRLIHHDSATKIALAFSVPFWEKDGIHGGSTVTDLPAKDFYYFSENTNFSGGVVVSYTWAQDSYRLTGIGEKECLRIALDNLVEIHGQHIRELYIGGVVKHWLLDPNTLGAYVFPMPCQHSKILNGISKDEGRLFFAGEYADFPIAWIETAIKSGLRAAAAVHKLKEVLCRL